MSQASNKITPMMKKNIPPKIRIMYPKFVCLRSSSVAQDKKEKRKGKVGEGVSSASESRPSGGLKWSKKDGFGLVWFGCKLPANGLIQSFHASDENGLAFGKEHWLQKDKNRNACMLGWMDGWMGWMDKWGQCSQEPWVVYSITEKWFCFYFSRLFGSWQTCEVN